MSALEQLERDYGITATDLFCGAGGSSTGAVMAGVKVELAANHSEISIKTHSTNHPMTEHDIADLQTTKPSRYRRTNILWISPECTNHSLAKGKRRKAINQLHMFEERKIDQAEERSRATMREVIEFTQYHRYDIVIVENVVDVRLWQHYDEWLQEMLDLGYDYKPLYINAMFFGVPQSRDRVYLVFWRKGIRPPNLEFRPPAICQKHGQIEAVQVFKKPEFIWGRYGKRRQYLYRCPHCGTDVVPFYTPAAAAIDWSIPSETIGDRKQPLKPKTIERVLAGLKKFQDQALLVDLSHSHAAHNGKVRDVESPMPTQTGQQRVALISPFIAELRNNSTFRGLDEALSTITAGGGHHGLVTPPFLVINRSTTNATGINAPRSVDDPLQTLIATAIQHYLVTPPIILPYGNQESPPRGTDDPLPATTTGYVPRLVTPPYLMSYYSRNDAQSGIDAPIPTIPTENRHALITPPMLTSVNYFDDRNIPIDQPMGTQTTQSKWSLVTPPLVMTYNGRAAKFNDIGQPLSTQTTKNRHALVTPEEMLPGCGFRMLTPEELKIGMSFPRDYIILGNQEQQVRQIGQAVAVEVARWIVRQCVEALVAA